MPNHIMNRLSIQADDDQVQAILEQIQNDQYGLGSIDFNKIIPMPEVLLKTEASSRAERGLQIYRSFLQDSADISRQNAELNRSPYEQRLAASALLKKYQTLTEADPELLRLGRQCYENLQNYGHADWYSWALANWDTKWTAYGFDDLDTFCEGDSSIQFLTAWSAPHPVLAKLSEMFPDVLFQHLWADEDFGCQVGEREYLGGEIVDENIPVNSTNKAYEMAADIWEHPLNSPESGLYLSADESCYFYLDESKTYAMIRLFGQPALYSSDYVRPADIPKGLYCYDLIQGDDGMDFYGIMPCTRENHAGSVITKRPIEFGSSGSLALSASTQPEFLGKDVTLPEYMQFASAGFEQTARRFDVFREPYELIEMFGQTALFTNERVLSTDLPYGLYCYHLREADDGSGIAAIELRVAVNHAGSIITKEPIELPENGYIAFTEETAPNFLGGEVTLAQYRRL